MNTITCRKIPYEQMILIDRVGYPSGEKMIPHLHKLGFTPNLITLISTGLGLTSLYLFYQKKSPVLILLLLALSIVVDAWDGCMARTYNMGSKLGAWLDTISDWLVLTPFMGLLLYRFWKYDKKLAAILSIIVAILGYGMVQYYSCIECYASKNFKKPPGGVMLLLGNKNAENNSKEGLLKSMDFYKMWTNLLHVVVAIAVFYIVIKM